MIYNDLIAKEIYNKNLSERGLKQKGFFKEKNIWIAFDNSTNDLFVEEFSNKIEAILWLYKYFEYSEKSYFKYFKVFKNVFYLKKTGFAYIYEKDNETQLIKI